MSIEIEVRVEVFWKLSRAARCQPASERRRVGGAARAVGLRQDHLAAHHRRARGGRSAASSASTVRMLQNNPRATGR